MHLIAGRGATPDITFFSQEPPEAHRDLEKEVSMSPLLLHSQFFSLFPLAPNQFPLIPS